ncbi:MAG: hypothetical protein BGN86_03635 [Caulobacterales bacterium 68-7]|nr:MAG: hypothetical protein BGN86_03635 [Caulobacterales bacterium 68-7]
MYVLPTPDYSRFSRFRDQMGEIDDAVRAEAFALFIKPFHARYRDILTQPRPDYEARIGAGDDILAALQTDGVALAKSDAGLKAKLNAVAMPLADQIEAHLAATAEPNFKDGQILLSESEHAAIYQAVAEVFEQAHIFDVSRTYARQPVKLAGIAVQVNTAATTLRKYKAIDAEGLPKKKTQYLHIDSSGWPHHKVLIYLNDVGLDEGPFRYVVGSHRMLDDFELAVRKTNDKLRIPPKLFMALPEAFRQLADFGDNIDPDSSEALALLQRERALYDDKASDLVLFDYHGVHRGGFVRQGARRILQVNFAAAS